MRCTNELELIVRLCACGFAPHAERTGRCPLTVTKTPKKLADCSGESQTHTDTVTDVRPRCPLSLTGESRDVRHVLTCHDQLLNCRIACTRTDTVS